MIYLQQLNDGKFRLVESLGTIHPPARSASHDECWVKNDSDGKNYSHGECEGFCEIIDELYPGTDVETSLYSCAKHKPVYFSERPYG